LAVERTDAIVTLAQLKRVLAKSKPPAGLAPPLEALCWAAKGDWDKAHRIVMNESGRDAAWVHAYLHRLEGDQDNAGYWYRQARQPVASGTHEAEWDAIAAALLEKTARSA
jgi:hypothetical protein